MDYRRSRPTRRTNPARRKLRRPHRHRHRTGRRPPTQRPRLPHPAPTPPHRPRQPPAPAADGQTAGRPRIARPAPDRRPARKIPRRPRRRPASRHPDRPRRRRPHQPARRSNPAGGTRHRRTPGRSRRNAVRRIPAIRLGGRNRPLPSGQNPRRQRPQPVRPARKPRRTATTRIMANPFRSNPRRRRPQTSAAQKRGRLKTDFVFQTASYPINNRIHRKHSVG